MADFARFQGHVGGVRIFLQDCRSCKHYEFTSGNFPHECHREASDTAANYLSHDKVVSSCEHFEPKKTEKGSSSKSSSGGKGRPVWLRIICCPCCCIWHTLGRQIDPSRGCKKAFTW